MEKVRNMPRYLDEIAIGQVIFDHSEWVSLWGYITWRGQQSRMDFILSFDVFNKLLRLSGKTGDLVQMLVVDQLEKGVEEPTVIDLEEYYGKPQCLNQCRLEVSKTGIQNDQGNWQPDPNCLAIDGVQPLLEKKTPTISPASLCKRNFSKCTELLLHLYELYLGYQELGFDEETALQKATLQDDLKFKMAYYAWRQQQAA